MRSRYGGRLVLLLSVTASIACSVGTPPFRAPAPEELPRLESELRTDSTNVDAVTAVAAGYAAEGQLEAARDLLERTLEELPSESTLGVMLGLIEQELGLDESASRHFEAYLARFSGAFAADIRAHRDAILGSAMRAEGARLVTTLPTTGALEPDPDQVVVIPFDHPEEDAALATGLTWLLRRAFEREGLHVTEDPRLQGVLSALGLEQAVAPELATTAELMRTLGAAHAIQGRASVDETGQLSWDVMVVTFGRDGRLTASSIPAEGALEDVPALAARVAAIAAAVTQGAAALAQIEEERVEVRPPGRVDALMAFARGLQAVDQEAWSAARAEFELATELDSSFEEAGSWVRRAQAVLRVESEPLLARLEAAARIGELRRAVLAVRTSIGSSQQNALARLGSRERTGVIEVLGLDRIGGGGQVTVTLEPTSGGGP